jgi:4-aminobutyrate aminotransferase-like enzyme
MEPKTRKILEMNAFDITTSIPDDNSLLARRLSNLGAASVLFYREPIEMKTARGAWMIDKNDVKYLDFYNNVPSVGHCHPKVVQAISEQVAKLNIHTRYLSEIVDNYLDRLKATFPENLDNVLLCCTGSEANDLALRIAYKKTGKRGVIVTETAYHGNTLAVTEVSPAALKNNPVPDHVIAIAPPSEQNYGEDIGQGFAAAMRKAIETLESRGHGFAAFLCDSIFSSDGVFSDPPGFLQPAVKIIREHGGVYIADEVQPGFGRTGSHMWGFQRHGVVPDLVTMGKPMGNGFPMAGVAAQAADVQKFCEDVGYFNTFGGNQVAAAAGTAVLDVLEEEDLLANASRVGNYLLERLRLLQKSFPVIGHVRGAGLFIGVDLCDKDNPLEPAPSLTSDVINHLMTRHILIGAAGKYGNTLKLRPPICLTLKEADIFLTALEDILQEVS